MSRSFADRVLVRSGADGGAPIAGVRLLQRGEMRLRPGARPLRFEAVQEIDARRVAFRWRSRFAFGPLRPLTVVDAYDGGQGSLEGRVAGVRAFRADGRDVARGEAMRYLAELAWIPHALRLNGALDLTGLGPTQAEAATIAGGERVAVRLLSDPSGDVIGASAPDRPRLEGGVGVPTPWRGRFWDHGELGGLRVPRRAEVAWVLPDGPFAYWRAEVTSLEVIAP